MGKGMKLSFMAKNFFLRVINMKAWLTYIILVVTFHLSVLSVSGQGNNAVPSKTGAQETGRLAEAVKLQYSADSLARLAQGVRKEMETATPERQEVLQSIAEEIESEAAARQAKADIAFMAAEQDDK